MEEASRFAVVRESDVLAGHGVERPGDHSGRDQ
jgi:hypothetical protein